MRILLQRVSSASVTLEDLSICGQIGPGLLILLGIESADTEEDIDYLIHKILQLRIFDDQAGVMNLCIQDIKGDLLVVSQFTLLAATKKGNRPSYIRAARPDVAIPLYEEFVRKLMTSDLKVATGMFGALMQIHLVNNGPVSIWLDSKSRDY